MYLLSNIYHYENCRNYLLRMQGQLQTMFSLKSTDWILMLYSFFLQIILYPSILIYRKWLNFNK